MTNRPHILDNRQENAKLVDLLRESLRDADTFRLVSAYFSIYGYRLLERQLASVDETRFLYGDPTSIDSVDPGYSEPKSFEVTERGLTPSHLLEQKGLAKRCLAWVEREGVRIRSMKRANFLHGKMYLADSARGATGVVGSSNFTERGLGGSTASNLELNLAVEDAETLRELREWFDALWNDEDETEDVKAEVVAALNRLGDNYSPEAVYYKTLYELFRREIEARLLDETQLTDVHLYDTEIWNALYEFQKDGAKSVIDRLRRHNGCILADSVGLGKTYTALAVIKHYELLNKSVLVLCPRKLRENWSLYQAHTRIVDNPFKSDRFGYSLLSHTDLSRDSGKAGDIDLERFDWGNFDLVVIDESHNFRNMGGARYERLLEEVIQQGVKTKVLMLSATPVNTSLLDLRSQIELMTEGRDDAFRVSLGIGSVSSLLKEAQKEFKNWESKSRRMNRKKTKLLKLLGAAFFRLLGGVSIARSRHQIQKFYEAEVERIGQFPKREIPVNRYPPTDLDGKLSYTDLANQIGKFALSIYRPSDYLRHNKRQARQLSLDENDNISQQQQTEYQLIYMMRVNFLKRLESSAYSLKRTLRRTIDKIDTLVEKIDRYRNRPDEFGHDPSSGAERLSHPLFERPPRKYESIGTDDVLPADDDDDEELFVNRGREPYRMRDLDLPKWKRDLIRDRETLAEALNQVAAVTPERDGKLAMLKKDIRRKMTSPTLDKDGKPNRKLLVFTTFKDTAVYLYENLRELSNELGIGMAMVSGDDTRSQAGNEDFNSILTKFAPAARNRVSGNETGGIDLLIATDCISEGQNLQDCDTVLNYDIHWNPVRIIQRFGRIDRIGSRNRSVRMFNYWPTKNMEHYLNLQSRVLARMALANATASGDEDPFTEQDAKMDMQFRDEQTLRLKKSVPDIDELADSVVMSDFTLDYFFAQLLRYLESNKDALEAMPQGVYAVTDAAALPGVVFFLRQRNADPDETLNAASPIHPHYMVYIRDNGHIRFGCANARQTLNVFEEAAIGKTEPITRLCDLFDEETDYGRNMVRYDDLLRSVIAHIRQTHGDAQKKGLGIGGERDFFLPKLSETPRDVEDFELVTWLAIFAGE